MNAFAIPLIVLMLLSGRVAGETLLNADHWAFQPRRAVAVPGGGAGVHPIDAFIRRALAEQGLAPAVAADRRTLIRRLTFNLHGLPPTPEEIAAFEADRAAGAMDRLVQRLLASPRHGERWARHWLDVARFCESQGFERDKLRPNAWHYRDYVIASLNADRPYDQFVREQIAGDVLEPVTEAGIIATGFLVGGPFDEVGSSQKSAVMRSRVREEDLEDVISAVGQTFLGVTIHCARCHDHKFDPIPQTDYYALKSVFEGVRHGERTYLTADGIAACKRMEAGLRRNIARDEDALRNLEQLGWQAGRERAPAGTAPPGPLPFARWEFAQDARDTLGKLNGTLKGDAKIHNGRLVLDGDGDFVETLTLHRTLREKTIEAWVYLADLQQRGGGVITVEGVKGSPFDALVFGERQPRRWMAGSDNFRRTRDVTAAAEEANAETAVHLAVVYSADHRIRIYRDGRLHAGPYQPEGAEAGLQTYEAGRARVLLGRRHTGGGSSFLKGAIEEARLYDRALGAAEVAASFRAGPRAGDFAQVLAALTEEQRREHERLRKRIAGQFEELKGLSALPQTYAATTSQPAPTRLLARGDVLTPKEEVAARGLSGVRMPPPDFGLKPDAPEAGRRRRFAAWVTHPDNPLTARVIVNRVWQHHFGRGIVDTPSDFGVSGGRPSHPELLDWLANWFVANGWSLKRLHRLILTSETYQQSSRFNEAAGQVDADNRLLWRFTPRRLEAEAVRDSLLALSGEINWQMGGPGYQPFELFISNTHFYIPKDKTGAEFNRRTIYRLGVQSLREPLLDTLDCPDLSTKTPVRGVTTTPIQALALMNDPFVQRQARQFVDRLRREADGDLASQLDRAGRLVFGRALTSEEIARAGAHAREHGLEQVCWALFNSSEFMYVR